MISQPRELYEGGQTMSSLRCGDSSPTVREDAFCVLTPSFTAGYCPVLGTKLKNQT